MRQRLLLPQQATPGDTLAAGEGSVWAGSSAAEPGQPHHNPIPIKAEKRMAYEEHFIGASALG